jgi:hypothetical protein
MIIKYFLQKNGKERGLYEDLGADEQTSLSYEYASQNGRGRLLNSYDSGISET